MNDENNKNSNTTNNKIQNAFNDTKQFLQLLLFGELYVIFLSIVQMIFKNRDVLPQIAAINTILFIATIYHIEKNKKTKK